MNVKEVGSMKSMQWQTETSETPQRPFDVRNKPRKPMSRWSLQDIPDTY